MQILELTKRSGKIRTNFKKPKYFSKTTQKTEISPNSQETIDCFFDNSLADDTIVIVYSNSCFENTTCLCLTSSFSEICASKTPIAFLIVPPNVVSLPKGAVVARFTILKPKQAKYLQPIDRALFNIHSSDINELVDNWQHRLPYPTNSFWFPTPEGCGDPDSLAGIQKIIFAKIKFLEEQEKLNPTKTFECRKKFVSNFGCKKSVLTAQEKDQIEEFLVCFHDVFAQHK